jgi:hypothetical protein
MSVLENFRSNTAIDLLNRSKYEAIPAASFAEHGPRSNHDRRARAGEGPVSSPGSSICSARDIYRDALLWPGEAGARDAGDGMLSVPDCYQSLRQRPRCKTPARRFVGQVAGR